MMNQAAQSAEFNKSLSQSRSYRSKGLEDVWNKAREPVVSTPQPQTVDVDAARKGPSSPHYIGDSSAVHPPSMLPAQQTPSHMAAQHYQMAQNPNQSPIRQSSMQASLRDSGYPAQPGLQRAPSNLGPSHGQQSPSQQASQFNFSSMAQQQAWGGPPNQPQASPSLSKIPTPQFSPSLQANPQQIPSPVHSNHPGQSPHQPQQIHPSQLHQPSPGQQMLSSGLQGGMPNYQTMGPTRQLYGNPGQQYLQQVTQAGGIPGWATSQPQSTQGGWSTY